MRCIVSLLIIGWACVAGAAAQPQRGPIFPQDKGPQGEAKLRWVCERLTLDDKQLGQVDGALIPVYQAEIEAERADGGPGHHGADPGQILRDSEPRGQW